MAIQISTPEKAVEKKDKFSTLLKSVPKRFTLGSTHTPFQVPDLWSFRRASIDAGGLETRSFAVLCRHLLDLLCQLTGGSQH